MNKKAIETCNNIRLQVERAMNSVKLGRLSPHEYDEIEQLKEKLDKACSVGDSGAASRIKKLIINVLDELD